MLEVLFRKIIMLVTAIDTETTGLDLLKHEIIQLGLIEYDMLDNGDLLCLQKSEFKIKPSNIMAASEQALKINGYNDKDWLNSTSFSKCFPILEKVFSKSDFLIGQNLIFDLRFIAKQYWKYGFNLPKIPKYIDTKYMGQQLVNEGKMKSCSMDSMCKYFNIKYSGRAHTALTDCERTIVVWEQLMKYTENRYFTFEDPYDAFKKINNAR
jgi:DNA polymerase III epsilon subunit-like protein